MAPKRTTTKAKAQPKRPRRTLSPDDDRRVAISVRVDPDARAWLLAQLKVFQLRSPVPVSESELIRLLIDDQRAAGWTPIAAAQRKVDRANEPPPALASPSK